MASATSPLLTVSATTLLDSALNVGTVFMSTQLADAFKSPTTATESMSTVFAWSVLQVLPSPTAYVSEKLTTVLHTTLPTTNADNVSLDFS